MIPITKEAKLTMFLKDKIIKEWRSEEQPETTIFMEYDEYIYSRMSLALLLYINPQWP